MLGDLYNQNSGSRFGVIQIITKRKKVNAVVFQAGNVVLTVPGSKCIVPDVIFKFIKKVRGGRQQGVNIVWLKKFKKVF